MSREVETPVIQSGKESCTKPTPDFIRYLILEKLKEPVVFREMINDWNALSWNLDKWAKEFGEKLLPFRRGFKKYTEKPQWENECHSTYLTMKEFASIQHSKQHLSLQSDDCQTWCYFDYKYMKEWFEEQSELLKGITWKNFGFPELEGKESTIWVGSEGAHTPCHMDSYGCNLVAQILGRKQWVLFPPDCSDALFPVRVPYEESSIYSRLNFYTPNKSNLDGLNYAYIITLNPGDVLFVPQHWWHYVENIETAISINTWIPLPNDDTSRLDESLVKLLISQLCKQFPEPEKIIYPNERDIIRQDIEKILDYVDTSVRRCHQLHEQCKSCSRDIHSASVSDYNVKNKSIKMSDEELKSYLSSTRYIYVVPKYESDWVQKLQFFSSPLSSKSNSSTEERKNLSSLCISLSEKQNPCENLFHEVINAFCHPEVIGRVRKILYKNLKRNI